MEIVIFLIICGIAIAYYSFKPRKRIVKNTPPDNKPERKPIIGAWWEDDLLH